MKKIFKKSILILLTLEMVIAPFKPFLFKEVLASETVKSDKNNDYVYLADIDYVYGQVGYSSVKINKNDSGEMISLNINNTRTYSMNAIFAHAKSTLIYDLSKYENLDTFSAYVGVDASRGTNGNGVIFHIYGTTDNDYNTKNWSKLHTTKALKGDSEAEHIQVSLGDYKYLKLEADSNGDNSNDHAVYLDAMLYNASTYVPKDTTISWLKKVEEYDEELLKYSDSEIISQKELKLKLMQRTFVKRVGYGILGAFANKSENNYEFISWLFNDEERLENYLLGGTPEGNNYLQALTVFENLYTKNKADLLDKNDGQLYEKMMMAISLAYGSDVNFWQTANKPVEPVRTPSNHMDRYDVIKKLYTIGYTYDNVSTYFEKENFKNLKVEEMRWVVNNRISDIEIAWLNWYTQMTKEGKTPYNQDSPYNPYTYIYYSTGWNYEDSNYYQENSQYCAEGNNVNKKNAGYKRGVSCNTKYGLEHFELQTKPGSPLRLWTIWEEDGVCGSLAGTGSNIEMSLGRPSTLVSQPGHAAYFVSSLKDWKGQTLREWQIGNAAAGWSASYKGERMLLNWGTKGNGWSDSNNGAYLLVAQRAVDNWEEYKKAFYYNLLGDLKIKLEDKIKSYESAINEQHYNVDAWYNLIQCYLQDENTPSSKYLELAKKITSYFFEFPLPMYDLLKLFQDKIVENEVEYTNLVDTTLNKQLKVSDKEYFQAAAIVDITKYLLKLNGDNAVATFSFDGENAKKLMLLGKYAENNTPFEYTLNYEYDALEQKVSSNTKWIRVEDGRTSVDLSDSMDLLNTKNDIVVHLLKDENYNVDNLFFIDLQNGPSPSSLYVNNLERRIANIDEKVAEWILIKDDNHLIDILMSQSYDDLDWNKFSEKLPQIDNKSGTMLFIRNGYTKTYLPSDPVFAIFDEKEDTAEMRYVPVANLEVKTSSSLNEDDEKKLLDRSINTFWQAKKDDEERTIILKSKNRSIELSKIEYVPRQDDVTVGMITKAKIEISADGDKWTEIANNLEWTPNKSIKTYVLPTPTKARYIKITALETAYNELTASMFNLYENTLTSYIDINTLPVSYVTEGYVYNGQEIKPKVTIKDGDVELLEDTHYSIKYRENVNAGTGTLEITGLGIYDGTIIKEFKILKANQPDVMPNSEMVASFEDKTLKDLSLPEGWHWEDETLTLKEGELITAKALYTDTDNYENTEVEIKVKKEIGHHPVIEVKDNQTQFTFEFDGNEQQSLDYFTDLITINDEEDGNILLSSNQVVIKSDINWQEQGTYHIIITVQDNDGNESSLTLEITIKKSGETISLNNDEYEIIIDNEELYYNGKELNLNVKVRKKGKAQRNTILDDSNTLHELTEGVDYTISYSELVKAGNHTVSVKGINIYDGTLTKNYVINKAVKPTTMLEQEMHVSNNTTKLEDIILSDLWQWENADIELVEGENKVKLIFLGDENHERYEMDVLIVKEKSEISTPTKPEEDKPTNPEVPTENPKDKEENTKPEITENNDNNDDKKQEEKPVVEEQNNNSSNNSEENINKPTINTNKEENITSNKETNKNTSSSTKPTTNKEVNETDNNTTNDIDNSKEDNNQNVNKTSEEVSQKEEEPQKNISYWFIIPVIVVIGGLIILIVKLKNNQKEND